MSFCSRNVQKYSRLHLWNNQGFSKIPSVTFKVTKMVVTVLSLTSVLTLLTRKWEVTLVSTVYSNWTAVDYSAITEPITVARGVWNAPIGLTSVMCSILWDRSRVSGSEFPRQKQGAAGEWMLEKLMPPGSHPTTTHYTTSLHCVKGMAQNLAQNSWAHNQ